MNSMKASFAGGVLHSTDSFHSRDCDEGRACRLWLVRDTRRGEKIHQQQSRLERYHQQRPRDW